MGYSTIGYAPIPRRIINNKNLTFYARQVYSILSSFIPIKKKNHGFFSQVKYCEDNHLCPKAFRLALRELAFNNLIKWKANEYGTTFEMLVEPYQKDNTVWLGRNAPHVNSSFVIYSNNKYLSSKSSPNAPNNFNRIGVPNALDTSRYLRNFENYEVAKQIPREARAFLDRLKAN